MRTIKFRAWDKGENKWLLGYEYPNLGGFSMLGETMMMGEYTNLISSYFPNRIKDIVLMQFTGLLDKNGKEIYEGDIVRCYDTAGEMVYDKEVDFFGFREEIWSKEKDGRTKVEIIGNIYKNPELLR